MKTCVESSRRILNPKQGAIAVIVIAAMTYVAVAQAQQPKKLPRLGYLTAADPASESTRAEAIRLALRDLGYIEGQNIAIEYRYAEGKLDRLPELAAELVRLKVDIIVVAGGKRIILAAKNATKTIPIVMAGGADPVDLSELLDVGERSVRLPERDNRRGRHRTHAGKRIQGRLVRCVEVDLPLPRHPSGVAVRRSGRVSCGQETGTCSHMPW